MGVEVASGGAAGDGVTDGGGKGTGVTGDAGEEQEESRIPTM